VPKDAWHWGSDGRVVNDPFGEPNRTPLFVGLPFASGYVDDDRMTSPSSTGELF
jgi:hypothetical protein